jgi:hypothetical protein
LQARIIPRPLPSCAPGGVYSSHAKEAAGVPEVTVRLGRDHLERLIGNNPIEGIVELIWNALDADAKKVEIELVQNKLFGLEEVRVRDDGEGIRYSDADTAFGNLGESLKKDRSFTHGHRHIHGERAQGRFRAFSIGNHVVWNTKVKRNGDTEEHVIFGDIAKLGTFVTSDDPKVRKGGKTGTEVTITVIAPTADSLTNERSALRLTEVFALYLRQYPNVQIIYHGEEINPSKVETAFKDYKLDPLVVEDGRSIASTLSIIEWDRPTERSLHICDAHGFSLLQTSSEVRAPGFEFTAYLKADFFRELANKNVLVPLNADLTKFVEKAKDKIRRHFKARESERAASILREWKEQGIYPYSETPKTEIQKSEQRVFDVVALNVNKYLAGFDRTDRQNKRLTLQLVKAGIEQGPRALRQILQSVLNLPSEKQKEFAKLLDQTSLTAIINASKTITDRLAFLRGLEILIFNPQSRKDTLERRHLHKILEHEGCGYSVRRSIFLLAISL